MKLAVSNIAWPTEQDAAVADMLAALDVSGIEVAPTKIWPATPEVSNDRLDDYRRFWNARGISIVAAQALLFGRPELTLFDSQEIRRQTLEYLHSIVRLCGRLGARALVFGSPKNRRTRGREHKAVWREAVDFFGRLGEFATAAGTVIVMEANPPEYGADFITRAAEAVELVRAVDHPGFRLHLDTACMTLAGDEQAAIIPAVAELLAHFHISEPQLAPLVLGNQGPVDHAAFARQLAAIRYRDFVSIEMRQTDPFDVEQIRQAVRRARADYGAPDA